MQQRQAQAQPQRCPLLEEQPHRAQMRPQLQQLKTTRTQRPPWQHGKRLVSPKATFQRWSHLWPSVRQICVEQHDTGLVFQQIVQIVQVGHNGVRATVLAVILGSWCM
jgi:hypothetical protein